GASLICVGRLDNFNLAFMQLISFANASICDLIEACHGVQVSSSAFFRFLPLHLGPVNPQCHPPEQRDKPCDHGGCIKRQSEPCIEISSLLPLEAKPAENQRDDDGCEQHPP